MLFSPVLSGDAAFLPCVKPSTYVCQLGRFPTFVVCLRAYALKLCARFV